ncbi:hypothetical protein [Salipaludibacillus daqingensis]|uniref:hypothetical protein n=1 Tax=Salipaludibacillus daqingensis TaxID=3041001 RepID=UPI00247667EB|nr:hypothetical protein [Salipaludibacillus daqingensis]
MNKANFKIPFIISVFLILSIFSNIAFNLEAFRFLVPVIIVAVGIGVIGVYLFGKDMKLHKNLHFISYVMTVGFAFVPVIGVYMEGGTRSYGFPSQWFFYQDISGYVSFNLIGFIVNYFIFYFILRLLSKWVVSFSQNGKWNEA